MSIAIPQWLALLLVGAGLVGVALALIVTVRAFIQTRSGEYYVIRDEARRTALRGLIVVLILILLTLGVILIPRQTPASELTPTIIPSPSPTSTPTDAPPAAVATVTPTARPTATEPFIPTSTPQATLPITLTQPLPSAVPPPGDARFEFWALAQDVDESNQPVNASAEFAAGTERIYLFFRYDGLLPDVPWSVVWYQDGNLLDGSTRLWESERPVGERFEFFTYAGGFPAGEYEVQVWLGDELQVRAAFSVVQTQG